MMHTRPSSRSRAGRARWMRAAAPRFDDGREDIELIWCTEMTVWIDETSFFWQMEALARVSGSSMRHGTWVA